MFVTLRALFRTDDTLLDGQLEDLSASGAFLAAPRCTVGAARTGAIEVDLPSGRISVPVKIVRVNDKGVGLRFFGTSSSRLPLANFMVERTMRK